MGWLSDLGKSVAKFYDPANALGLQGGSKKKTTKNWGVPFTNQTPTGTGTAFLNSLDWGGAGGLTMEQLASNPFGGGPKANYSPAFIAQFLKGEMGPGGALGTGAQTRTTALGMGQIVAGGEADIAQGERELAAAGVASPALAAIRSANRSVLADRARGYSTQRRMEQEQQRYDAMEGFVNMVAGTVAATKGQELNYELGKKSAKATKEAAYIGAAGSIIGGLL